MSVPTPFVAPVPPPAKATPSPAVKPRTPSPARFGPKSVPLWAWVVGVVALGAAGWYGWGRLHPADSGVGQVVTGVVKRGDLVETVSATGSIAAQTGAQVKIGSQITGRIKHLYADVGTVVKAGDLIAELDLPDVQAQLDNARASHAAAQSRLTQQQQNVTLTESQTSSGIGLAAAGYDSATQRLKSARAALTLQTIQTPSDIRRATAGLGQARAILSTARSSQVQVVAGANLQIQNAQEAVNQAVATDFTNQAELVRQQGLVDKGYVAGKIVEQARQAASVSASLLTASRQDLALTQQKITADLQAAADVVTQATQGIDTALATQQAAEAEKYLVAVKRADVADATASVAQAQSNLNLARGNLTGNAVRRQDVQQARDAIDQAAAQIKVNQSQVNKTVIRTPISGTVLQLAAQQGETLAAGLSAPTLIIVADLKRLEVDAYVDETDIGKVKLGQPVDITVDAFPELNIRGKVAKVASGSTIQQGVVTYGVTIYIEDTSHALKPDMTANVNIETGRRTNVLIVPSVAVQVGVSQSTVGVLSKKDGQTSIKTTKVVTGGTDGINIEIVSGLKEGDPIVLAGGNAKPSSAASSSPFGSAGGGGGRPGGGGGGGGRPGG